LKHHRRGFLVGYEFSAIIRRFHISIRSQPPDVTPISYVLLMNRPALAADV
jgi:hypothetical protein